MKRPALFLLLAAALSGCISDSPESGAVALQYRRLFEVGRRAELEVNLKIAEDTYGWLIRCGSHYGEYGLAMLLLKSCPDRRREAVKCLLSCAAHSSSSSSLCPDSAMDLAFSAAAMAKLSDIALSVHGRPDVAASLHGMMSDIIAPQVNAWAEEMKANAEFAAIYEDVISAVESNCQVQEHASAIKWGEISSVFLNEESGTVDPKDIEGRSACGGVEAGREQTKGMAR